MFTEVDGRNVEVRPLGSLQAVWNQRRVPGGTEVVVMVVTASKDSRGVGMSIHTRSVFADRQEAGEAFVVMGEDDALLFINLMRAALQDARERRASAETA